MSASLEDAVPTSPKSGESVGSMILKSDNETISPSLNASVSQNGSPPTQTLSPGRTSVHARPPSIPTMSRVMMSLNRLRKSFGTSEESSECTPPEEKEEEKEKPQLGIRTMVSIASLTSKYRNRRASSGRSEDGSRFSSGSSISASAESYTGENKKALEILTSFSQKVRAGALATRLSEAKDQLKSSEDNLAVAAEYGLSLLNENQKLQEENILLLDQFKLLDEYASEREKEMEALLDAAESEVQPQLAEHMNALREAEFANRKLKEKSDAQSMAITESEQFISDLEEHITELEKALSGQKEENKAALTNSTQRKELDTALDLNADLVKRESLLRTESRGFKDALEESQRTVEECRETIQELEAKLEDSQQFEASRTKVLERENSSLKLDYLEMERYNEESMTDLLKLQEEVTGLRSNLKDSERERLLASKRMHEEERFGDFGDSHDFLSPHHVHDMSTPSHEGRVSEGSIYSEIAAVTPGGGGLTPGRHFSSTSSLFDELQDAATKTLPKKTQAQVTTSSSQYSPNPGVWSPKVLPKKATADASLSPFSETRRGGDADTEDGEVHVLSLVHTPTVHFASMTDPLAPGTHASTSTPHLEARPAETNTEHVSLQDNGTSTTPPPESSTVCTTTEALLVTHHTHTETEATVKHHTHTETEATETHHTHTETEATVTHSSGTLTELPPASVTAETGMEPLPALLHSATSPFLVPAVECAAVSPLTLQRGAEASPLTPVLGAGVRVPSEEAKDSTDSSTKAADLEAGDNNLSGPVSGLNDTQRSHQTPVDLSIFDQAICGGCVVAHTPPELKRSQRVVRVVAGTLLAAAAGIATRDYGHAHGWDMSLSWSHVP